MALQTLDLSQNELDTANLQQAIERLEALRPNVKAVLTDEIKTLMVNNDAIRSALAIQEMQRMSCLRILL